VGSVCKTIGILKLAAPNRPEGWFSKKRVIALTRIAAASDPTGKTISATVPLIFFHFTDEGLAPNRCPCAAMETNKINIIEKVILYISFIIY
jgi:hypothetical protein